jgi:hypothetical protein
MPPTQEDDFELKRRGPGWSLCAVYLEIKRNKRTGVRMKKDFGVVYGWHPVI